MMSLTAEAKEIVRLYMADGKVATRKEINDEVERSLSDAKDYRVNILNGVIKVLTENHELEVVDRGRYRQGSGMPCMTKEQLALKHMENCIDKLRKLCVYNVVLGTEEELALVEQVGYLANEISKLHINFKNDFLKKKEAVKEEEKAPAEKEKAVVEKKEPVKEVPVKEEPKAVEAPKSEKEPAEKKKAVEKKSEPVKEEPKVEKAVEAPKSEKSLPVVLPKPEKAPEKEKAPKKETGAVKDDKAGKDKTEAKPVVKK